MLLDSLFGRKLKKDVISDSEAREKYGVQLPRYESIDKDGYELRRYQAMSIVECPYESRPQGYELLGAYSSGGENALDLPMPKTCPCVMQPCLEPQKLMFYVLPSPHTPVADEEALVNPPLPTERLQSAGVRTRVLQLDQEQELDTELRVAVVKFSGYATPDVVFKCRDDLKSMLARDGLDKACYSPSSSSSDSASSSMRSSSALTFADADARLMIAQYNELFSLPWNRDNEVWLPLGKWPQEQ